ncbi:16S rRNA (cytosine(967)-C(5))-methyltransferase RsmB [Sinanaerobacter sp. ZZT-01]|uniref:16S rRNA (cytosine(967)-C(5))-methyltransferase RsmB n=1 Tax=Sinanaerobacter sp. ZZT-01 TaxID=3111540 RepID=UPI002D792BF8|nr:16S rRNA (cytosine(967)-C(5))-methyltransferase RsmB [Sinanaerobacter sp. ZZT-01]WRR92781.1 16S rRNA (cytosine(967)-C(5))-methyltransferase RsmB [Sinanaerobacter sp. ZZT-01]
MDDNRKTAFLALLEVEEKSAYSNLVLNRYIKQFKPDSPSLVREIVYGVIENKYYLDYILSHFITKMGKVKKSDLLLLRMGVYQLCFMNAIPPYAAVNESVLLAKKYCRGRDGFINAVLRRYQREKDKISLENLQGNSVGYLSVKYSYEPWMIEQWIKEYGFEFTEALLVAGNQTPPLTLRVNSLKNTVEEALNSIQSAGFKASKGMQSSQAVYVKGSGILESPLYQKGLFSVQDESSMRAVETLDPKPGQIVVDVCAAPGGKTSYIAEKMENQGHIFACDVYLKKLELIQKEAERLGVSIVETQLWDATKQNLQLYDVADRVLVDAPCSGLGVVRRKPEIKYKKLDSELKLLPEKQLQILSNASNYLKAGGVLVYSTCTISVDENQKVSKTFLLEHPNYELVKEEQLFPHKSGTDGFYICKMCRRF